MLPIVQQLRLRRVEDDHFEGQIVSSSSMEYSDSVIKVFKNDVNSYLNTIKARLAEFRVSRGLLIFSDNPTYTILAKVLCAIPTVLMRIVNSPPFEKLAFIDAVIDKYNNPNYEEIELVATRRLEKSPKSNRLIIDKNNRTLALNRADQEVNGKVPNTETITDKTSVLPRSFMRTLNRIKREIDPKAEDTEEEVVKKFRKSRNKTAISIRFLLIFDYCPFVNPPSK